MSRWGARTMRRFTLPVGFSRTNRFLRPGRTFCREISRPCLRARSVKNEATLSSPVSSGSLGRKAGFTLGRATRFRRSLATEDSLAIKGNGLRREVHHFPTMWSSISRSALIHVIMLRRNGYRSREFGDLHVAVVDSHDTTAVQLDADGTFFLCRTGLVGHYLFTL